LTGEEFLLHGEIRARAKAGENILARARYQDLVTLRGLTHAPDPFIVYQESVHSDQDLEEVEYFFAQYLQSDSLEPVPVLQTLATSASQYIAQEIEKESRTLAALNALPMSSYTIEDEELYIASLKRRLALMQTHIITLQDPRYLDHYLTEMEQYIFSENIRIQSMMTGFFLDHFCVQVANMYAALSDEEDVNIDSLHSVTALRLHLIQIAANFSHFSFLPTLREQIDPLIIQCQHRELITHGVDEGIDPTVLRFLSYKLSNYDALLESTQRLYEDFVQSLDEKYSMMYRRMIQNFFGDMQLPSSGVDTGETMQAGESPAGANTFPVFAGHPDITLLVFLEQMIGDADIPMDSMDIEECIEQYGLGSLSMRGQILLLSFLYECNASWDKVVQYILNHEELLESPYILYILTEYLRLADERESKRLRTLLDRIVKNAHGSRNFFDYVRQV